MRTLVTNTIKTALAGTALEIAPGNLRVYALSALGVGDVPAVPEKPFILVTAGLTTPFPEVRETSDAEGIPFSVYVYDDLGSYVRIEEIIRKFEGPVKTLEGLVSPTGATCLGSVWGGVSQDFIDPTYEASAKFATFTVTGSHHKEA